MERELHQGITELYEFNIKKKKSAIITLFSGKDQWNKYRGYPVIRSCMYLDVNINNRLNPIDSLHEMNKTLGMSLSRNEWLMKKYFSVNSLIQMTETPD